MKSIKLRLAMTLLICVQYAYSDELPLGSYGKNHPENATFGEKIGIWHDSLGFNCYYGNFTYQEIQELANSSINAIYEGDSTDAIYKYSYYNYAKIEAERCDYGIRMYDCGGSFESDGDDSVWVSVGTDMLFGPNGFNPPCYDFCDDSRKQYVKMERKYHVGADAGDCGDSIVYSVTVRIKIDSVGDDVPVCSLKVTCEPDNGKMVDTLRIRAISTQNIGTADTWAELTGEFVIPESVYVDYGASQDWVRNIGDIGVAVIIETLGAREVKIDWIKIYDDKGFELVEGNQYRNEIQAYADSMETLGSDLWGFYLRDEPYYIGIPVIGAIMDTARAYGTSAWEGITAIHVDYNYRWWFDNNPNSNVFTADIYPFISAGYQNEPYYAGFDPNAVTLNDHRISKYIQNRFRFFDLKCDSAFYAAADSDAEFWIILQCFIGGDSTGTFWRKPTPAELKCETFIALASGARGIIYWKYGTSYDPEENYFIEGIYNLDDEMTDLGVAIIEDINPYIKAIDDTYLGLTFRQGYYFSPEIGFDTSAAEAYIDTIFAISDMPNPDLGWFQIGEYTNGDDKYIMIVNRACSKGPDDPTPAPPVTATVNFKTMNLEMGNYIEIIDLASNTSFSDWVGTPDTTRAESIRGVITYSTELGPGEGRLFKLVQSR